MFDKAREGAKELEESFCYSPVFENKKSAIAQNGLKVMQAYGEIIIKILSAYGVRNIHIDIVPALNDRLLFAYKIDENTDPIEMTGLWRFREDLETMRGEADDGLFIKTDDMGRPLMSGDIYTFQKILQKACKHSQTMERCRPNFIALHKHLNLLRIERNPSLKPTVH